MRTIKKAMNGMGPGPKKKPPFLIDQNSKSLKLGTKAYAAEEARRNAMTRALETESPRAKEEAAKKKAAAPKKKMKMGGRIKKAQTGTQEFRPGVLGMRGKGGLTDLEYATDSVPKKPRRKLFSGRPKAKTGKQMLKRADGSVSPRGLWDNIRSAAKRNKAAGKAGKKPTAAMLKQEKKIKAKGK